MKVLGYIVSGLLLFCGLFISIPLLVSSIVEKSTASIFGSIVIFIFYTGLGLFIVYLLRRVDRLEKLLSKN